MTGGLSETSASDLGGLQPAASSSLLWDLAQDSQQPLLTPQWPQTCLSLRLHDADSPPTCCSSSSSSACGGTTMTGGLSETSASDLGGLQPAASSSLLWDL